RRPPRPRLRLLRDARLRRGELRLDAAAAGARAVPRRRGRARLEPAAAVGVRARRRLRREPSRPRGPRPLDLAPRRGLARRGAARAAAALPRARRLALPPRGRRG